MATEESPTRLGLVSSLRASSAGLGNWQLMARTAIATTLAVVFGEAISPSETAVMAALSAMLVVQSSAFATVGMTIQRIIGTTVGVLAASIYINLLGDSLLVYAGGILLALALAKVMPIAESARSQVTISMLVVLTLGPGEWVSDIGRVIDTMVGGLIAMAVVLIYPPKPNLRSARAAFAEWYEAVAVQLEAMARGIGRGPLPRGKRHDFVAASFGLRELDVSSRASFLEAVESVQFNPRAHRDVTEQLDLLERDLRWITSVTVQVRALSGEVDRLYDRTGGLPPVLAVEQLSPILLSVARLLRAEVHPGAERAAIERRARRVQGMIGEAAGFVMYGRRDVTEVLQSLTLLGRIDSLARTIHGGPGRLAVLPWEQVVAEEVRQPVPAPTGFVTGAAPENDPTMTIALPLLPRRTGQDGEPAG
jgi:hypothetical protein